MVPYATREHESISVFTVTATDKASGEILAQTKVVVPVVTELAARVAMGGWRKGVAGISAETSEGISTCTTNVPAPRSWPRQGRPAVLVRVVIPDPL